MTMVNPMADMMGDLLKEAFADTFASKEDIAELHAKLDKLCEFVDTLNGILKNAGKNPLAAKLLGL